MAKGRVKREQVELVFRTHGGRRPGAGRPAKGARAGERHKARPEHDKLLFAGALALAVTALYWTSFSHGLLFDDERLRDGTVFGEYGGLWPWRPRLLSYGSFVWVQALLGEHWVVQRAVNVALHLAPV